MVTDEQFQDFKQEVRQQIKEGFDDGIEQMRVLFEQHKEEHVAEGEQIKYVVDKLDRLEADMREVKQGLRIVKNRLKLP